MHLKNELTLLDFYVYHYCCYIYFFHISFFILLCVIFTLLTNFVLSHFNYRVDLVYVS